MGSKPTSEENSAKGLPGNDSPTHITSKSPDLKESRAIYELDKSDGLHIMYVTILKSGSSKNKPVFSFSEMNNTSGRMPDNEADPQVEVIIQEGDETGPVKGGIGFNEKTANATLEIRGNTSRAANQKSYKIKLNNKAGLWQEHKILNLNKHAFELSRVRNKLSFDYLKLIPNMSSLRTHFVQLKVKDLTTTVPAKEFVDYGLYTDIEQPDKTFLKYHGLDPNGNLYKANNFLFQRYPDVLVEANDPRYNKSEFEKILKINASENHTKFLHMLDEVNDTSKNINDIVDTYFNRDNFLTWMATNILLDNTDTINQNYMLYSPSNSETWYFLPWDYDGGWDWYGQGPKETKLRASWGNGIANYWDSLLQRRFFKDPANVKQLNEKIEELSKIITKERTQSFLNSYHPIVTKFVNNAPDINTLPAGGISFFENEYKRLVNVPELKKKDYYKSLENPMPIFLGVPEIKDNVTTFYWDQSFDLQGDELSYDFQLSKDPQFTKIVAEQPGLKIVHHAVSGLTKGTYYWRVSIKDSKGNTQIPFDDYTDVSNNIYYGMLEYIVN
ncbi:CotH kinase family protein [Paenibacillus sp. HWE-109]|uniref:CotH kinase family protein n=1 Tax=Paenibacillus sp. HWE-109 TaxID=1306526 RepID=UPI001EE10040|nr:CotH kinase family protein [Paenibacillus sp. HWE-109]UKS25800.1 CotH kinase family protein [Paenibacillus sp. HWE-109]